MAKEKTNYSFLLKMDPEEINEYPAVELNKPPPAFQHVLANYRMTRDFTEACASCLIPLAPSSSNSSLVLCEKCKEKWRKEHPELLPEDNSDFLSSTDSSLSSLSDKAETTRSQDFAHLEREANLNRLFLRVEEELRREESEALNRSLLNNAGDSCPRSRIAEIVNRALKACGYVAGAVIGVPLIAGNYLS